MSLRLNLGCGDRAVLGFMGVDIVIGPGIDWVTNLAERWPWDDSSVSDVIAYDVIEHIADRIHFMNELWRVLEPGGCATIETPNASRGAGFWQDPTHKAGWCRNSFQYFQDGSFAWKRLATAYGIRARFDIQELTESVYKDVYEEVWKIRAVLRAVKSLPL